MLDNIKSIDKGIRPKILKKIKRETAERIFVSIPTLTEELELDKINDFEERTKLRAEHIKKFPEDVFWDFAEFVGLRGIVKFDNVKVSNKGELAIFGRDGKLYYRECRTEGKKKYDKFNIDKIFYSVHRVIATTFCPKDERLKNADYKDLHVNHKDGVKYHNSSDNLEWVTGVENALHGYKYNDYTQNEYYHITVHVDNGYKNSEFIVSSDELDKIGLTPGAARIQSRNRGDRLYYGMQLKRCLSPEGQSLGYPPGLTELFNKNRKYFIAHSRPIIGEIVVGRYAGLKFSLFGTNEIKRYFTHAGINQQINRNNSVYYSCVFKYATHEEAIKYHGLLTKVIYAELLKNRR